MTSLLWLLAIGYGSSPPRAAAFPPALPHTFYGLIRDEQGNPLPAGASITLESAAGVKVYGRVSGMFEPGVNYRLQVPLDAGLTTEAYRPTALNPRAPFKIKVTVGRTTFLPIEMSHDFALMGDPGKSTLLNLTLGVDSNGDGLPDAWQSRINADLGRVKPGDDADVDGLTNLEEYLAGTYASDPKSGFVLTILRLNGPTPVLAFTAIAGRTYSVLGSLDLETWTPVSFRLAAATGSEAATERAHATPMASYSAPDVRGMEVEVVSPAGQPVPRFFKLMLQ